MHNLIEYGDNSFKILGSLWQYYRDEATLCNDKNIIDFPANNYSIPFNVN